MISRETSKLLNLKSYTLNGCKDLYAELQEKYSNLANLKSDFLHEEMDAEFLNKVWWVLNYHSDTMDRSRKLRAIVEARLDRIAEKGMVAHQQM